MNGLFNSTMFVCMHFCGLCRFVVIIPGFSCCVLTTSHLNNSRKFIWHKIYLFMPAICMRQKSIRKNTAAWFLNSWVSVIKACIFHTRHQAMCMIKIRKFKWEINSYSLQHRDFVCAINFNKTLNCHITIFYRKHDWCHNAVDKMEKMSHILKV